MYASRTHKSFVLGLSVTAALCGFAGIPQARGAISLSQGEAQRIGRKIWQNECDGTVSGLTSWNAGEDFASLGIGHFIWYPAGKPGPFEESFPKLVAFVSSHGAKLPTLLLAPNDRHCPWKSRADFLLAQQTPDMKQLRQFLADTVDLQTQFMVDRLDSALSKMLSETSPANRGKIAQRFQRLANSPRGCYALVDYVNFKGEGVLPTERYHNQGWGLRQVLEEMHDTNADPVEEFSRSAALVLHSPHGAFGPAAETSDEGARCHRGAARCSGSRGRAA
jgi:hypothetical protein